MPSIVGTKTGKNLKAAFAKSAALKRPGAEFRLAIGHPAYRHVAVLAETTRAELAEDLD